MDDGFGNPINNRNDDPNRLYVEDRDFARSNASAGWIVGAVAVLGILVYAFGWKAEDQTAETAPPAPVTMGQNSVRPSPTPGPIAPAPAPSLAPVPDSSTTGSAPAPTPAPAQ